MEPVDFILGQDRREFFTDAVLAEAPDCESDCFAHRGAKPPARRFSSWCVA